jgi:uncharacterized protein YjeT (DUF2065 family)
MDIRWHDFAAAAALYLVFEGLLPFLNPGAAKRAFATLAEVPPRVLRTVGLASMLGGCALLYLIRGAAANF